MNHLYKIKKHVSLLIYQFNIRLHEFLVMNPYHFSVKQIHPTWVSDCDSVA